MTAQYEKNLKLVLKYIKRVFPKVDNELKQWADICKNAKDSILVEQGLASIGLKRFHAQGGCIYALYPDADLDNTIKFIVSLQTISDYLDNLCDRVGVQDEASFRQLHLSMLDAIAPDQKASDYYLYYPYNRDNNYLESLVKSCRSQISLLPSYNKVADTIKKYVALYSELQTYKHLSPNIREKRLSSWAKDQEKQNPDISCWEFSAATGSTLGIFILFAAAHDPLLTVQEVCDIETAYFPWICGLHILLDYYIDAREDIITGDLNFTYYYENLEICERRLSHFVDKSLECCKNLKYPDFHTTIIKGLLAMYLSDPKALRKGNKPISLGILKRGGRNARLYYILCRLLRRCGKL